MPTQIFSGRDIDAAVKQASVSLNMPIFQLNYSILEKGNLLKPAKILVFLDDGNQIPSAGTKKDLTLNEVKNPPVEEETDNVDSLPLENNDAKEKKNKISSLAYGANSSISWKNRSQPQVSEMSERPPFKLSVDVRENGKITLCWNGIKEPISGYYIMRSDHSGNEVRIGKTQNNQIKFTDPEPPTGQNVKYQVLAYKMGVRSSIYGKNVVSISEVVSIDVSKAEGKVDSSGLKRNQPVTVISLMTEVDSMDGHEFEHFCARLLKINGFEEVKVTPGSGDQGLDIIAVRDGVKHGIQCKCYGSDLGNKAVQEAFAGRTFYRCHVAVVLTNRYFTKAAKELADVDQVVLWNRDKLAEFISNAVLRKEGNNKALDGGGLDEKQ